MTSCRLTLPEEVEAVSEDGVWEADWDSDESDNGMYSP